MPARDPIAKRIAVYADALSRTEAEILAEAQRMFTSILILDRGPTVCYPKSAKNQPNSQVSILFAADARKRAIGLAQRSVVSWQMTPAALGLFAFWRRL